MDFIVKDLDSNYRLDAFRNKADKIIFEISTFNCPYCGKESKRILSRYQREIQYLLFFIFLQFYFPKIF